MLFTTIAPPTRDDLFSTSAYSLTPSVLPVATPALALDCAMLRCGYAHAN